MPCDYCGALAWSYLFTESGIDLGRCGQCGLHYIAQMPSREQRITEMKEGGHFAAGQTVCSAEVHLEGETMQQQRFQGLVDITQRFASNGKWLDIGCGTGTFIRCAQNSGIVCEGIELIPQRRSCARQLTGADVHDRPLEIFDLTPESFAAVTLINVFSHLTCPTQTFSHIHRILARDGIMMLHTGEVGPEVRQSHIFSWELGDHLYFLGENTINHYAEKTRFRLIHRGRTWQPATIYTRERFKRRGSSKLRNFAKLACLYAPRAFSLVRWYMLKRRHADNPIYTSTLIRRKV